MTHKRQDRTDGHDRTRALRQSTRLTVAHRVSAALVAASLVGTPTASTAQGFDNRPSVSRDAPGTATPSSGLPTECPPWLAEPYIVEALRREAPNLRNELTNQIGLSQLMNARGLVDREILFNKLRSDLAGTVMRATNFNSRSPRVAEEISERNRFVRGMSYQAMAVCLPQIASLLTEAEGRVATADKAEAERQAEARSPAGRIAMAYAGYEALRRCYSARAGRMLAYFTHDDVEDAKRKTKAIEQRLVRENPDLDVDALWAEATKPPSTANNLLGFSLDPDVAGRADVDDGDFTPQGKAYCQGARRRVEDAYIGVFADEAKPKKDF